MKKVIFLVTFLLLSCVKDYNDIPDNIPSEQVKIVDYNQPYDVLRNFNSPTVNVPNLGIYSDCGYDTTTSTVDFDLDGDLDFIYAPLCHDDFDRRNPPIVFFENDGADNFSIKNINIDNNIGLLSGTRMSIYGDFNNDTYPDVAYISHNGHGGPGGFVSFLTSKFQNNTIEYTFYDIEMDLGWYSYGASGDIDNDGDLDIIVGGGDDVYLENTATGWKIYSEFIINNDSEFPTISQPNLIDMNNDGLVDLVYHNGYSFNLIYNKQGYFDFAEHIEIPLPQAYDRVLQMQDKILVDLDSDGDLDIISNSGPHDADLNGDFNFIQFIENKGNTFVDVTENVYGSIIHRDRYISWLRASDLDNDGLLDIFETVYKDSDWFHLEWNGIKFE